MTQAHAHHDWQARLALDSLQTADTVPQLVDSVLNVASDVRASDVHFTPTRDTLEMQWRIDGVLHLVAEIPGKLAPNIIARLKVMADLLTYRTDVPQEGRLRDQEASTSSREMRLSTFPTVYGEKAVVRLFSGAHSYREIGDLGLPLLIEETLKGQITQSGGVILITGPAGSGKTTTAYACLREIKSSSERRRSIVTLEDPIEVILPGVAQTQVNEKVGLNLAAGVRSLLRQDPDVMMIGEIRDPETAHAVFQAALTGHLVITTFHAGSAAQAVTRLADMGIEPYQLSSGLLSIISQRLLRRLCDCAKTSEADQDKLGLDLESVPVPVGCPKCDQIGYKDRVVTAEMLVPQNDSMRQVINHSRDTNAIESEAIAGGMQTIRQHARELVANRLTSPQELVRVWGTSKQAGNHSS